MAAVLQRAGCFAAVILLGWVLRRIGFFKAEDFNVLAKMVLKLTLPAAIVVSFAGRQIDGALLLIPVLGFGLGAVYLALAFLLNRRSDPRRRAFELLNLSGYNIGNFMLPFAQSFLGPAGVITASLFDTGNAVICLGGAYGVASAVQENAGFSFRRIAQALMRSVPFITYLVMIALSLARIMVPQTVVDFAQLIADANAFLAMLMVGVGFRLAGGKTQLVCILRILAVRYAVAVIAALACYHLLPLALEYRQTLALLVFSPVSSSAPAFTAELGNDTGAASAVNSISILIGIGSITALLALMLQ